LRAAGSAAVAQPLVAVASQLPNAPKAENAITKSNPVEVRRPATPSPLLYALDVAPFGGIHFHFIAVADEWRHVDY
jgi:hypothetical protein